jgi:hypothetical protein
MGKGCPRDFNTDMFTDPRYQIVTQFKINEYDLMNTNNVLQPVRNLPGYYFRFDSYDESKRSTIYTPYNRPTISWKQSCSKDSNSRMAAWTLYSQGYAESTNS